MTPEQIPLYARAIIRDQGGDPDNPQTLIWMLACIAAGSVHRALHRMRPATTATLSLDDKTPVQ